MIYQLINPAQYFLEEGEEKKYLKLVESEQACSQQNVKWPQQTV